MKSKRIFLLLTFLITYTTCFAQEKSLYTNNNFLPKSIYTKNILNNYNSTFLTNNRLNLKQYKFAYLDVRKLSENNFIIPLSNINKPSNFIFDTYKDIYNKRNLEKSFFDVSKLYLPYIPEK